jgi:hypothetical protein
MRSVLIAVLLLPSLLWMAPESVRAQAQRQIQDPHYGEVLFQFYKGDYFTAIVHLMAAQQLRRMPHHEVDADLLLGGMDLSYGLHVEAGRIFERVLDENTEAAIRNQAWYFLGKIAYQRGYYRTAVERLRHTDTEQVSQTRQAEIRLLLAQALMAQAHYAKAAEILNEVQWPGDLEPYGTYNRGVALIKGGRREEGVGDLRQVGGLEALDGQQAALRDRANLVLAYILLEARDPKQAAGYFERIRLQGPYSNSALLGDGWAAAQQSQYKMALSPWDALRGRDVADKSVQEAMLALPYALGELRDYGRAASLYQQAVDAFDGEIARLHEAIGAIRAGKLVTALRKTADQQGMGWFWEMDTPPDLPETRYLGQFMADHGFQETLKNFRDLIYLQRNLMHWRGNVAAYDDMLGTRRERYARNLPRAERTLQDTDLAGLRERRDTLKERFQAIRDGDDVLGLASAEERRLWAHLVELEGRIHALGGDTAAAQLSHKQRLLKGVLWWRLNQAYAQRLWETDKRIRVLDEALARTGQQLASLRQVAQSAPAGFEGFSTKIRGLRERLERSLQKVKLTIDKQKRFLEDQAIAELQRRNVALAARLVHARFAMAQAYDRAALEHK